MPTFSGSLNSNHIFAALYNMIISQTVFADNIQSGYGSLVDKARVDGSLYGDTKLYYATDVLKTRSWGADSEATNLLAINRPKAPEQQALVFDQFRQIDITIDNYLSKQAWSNPDSFSSFNAVILGWIRETKRVYDQTLYNSFIGTEESIANRHEVEAPIAAAVSGLTGEEAFRVQAETIAQTIADLLVDMRDVSRDFNDYKFLRSYDVNNIKIIWNAKWKNKITKRDLPTMFHKDGLVDKMDEDYLPKRFFGRRITSSNISGLVYDADTNPSGPLTLSGTTYTIHNDSGRLEVRTLSERDVTVSDTTYHLFPGDRMPSGSTFAIATEGDLYYVDEDIICKVLVKLPPIMSAFEVGTSFFNARSLTENHYLTWGYNSLEHLYNYPLITVSAD